MKLGKTEKHILDALQDKVWIIADLAEKIPGSYYSIYRACRKLQEKGLVGIGKFEYFAADTPRVKFSDNLLAVYPIIPGKIVVSKPKTGYVLIEDTEKPQGKEVTILGNKFIAQDFYVCTHQQHYPNKKPAKSRLPVV